MKKIFLLLLFITPTFVLAEKFESDASYRVCFTPGEECTQEIVSVIDQSQKQILVQAYSFTSVPIAHALTKAYKRGVNVKVILDKSQQRPQGFSAAKMLNDYRIPVWIDYQPAIAHNKVMIIDDKTIITGSFNFTRAAQERNAENVLIIKDTNLAKKYTDNWKERKLESEALERNKETSPFDDTIYKVGKLMKKIYK